MRKVGWPSLSPGPALLKALLKALWRLQCLIAGTPCLTVDIHFCAQIVSNGCPPCPAMQYMLVKNCCPTMQYVREKLLSYNAVCLWKWLSAMSYNAVYARETCLRREIAHFAKLWGKNWDTDAHACTHDLPAHNWLAQPYIASIPSELHWLISCWHNPGSLEWSAASMAWLISRPAPEHVCLWLLDMSTDHPFCLFCPNMVPIDWA
jgi:hypothetical protein